jgi:hypothetical protein
MKPKLNEPPFHSCLAPRRVRQPETFNAQHSTPNVELSSGVEEVDAIARREKRLTPFNVFMSVAFVVGMMAVVGTIWHLAWLAWEHWNF